jgi:hypothetical protein
MNNYTIFNTFNLQNDVEFQSLIDSLNKEQSIFFLISSVKYAYSKGVFTLEESEIISNCIRKLYLPEEQNNTNDINEKRDE